MNKKEFYEAPEWGMRMVVVEKRYLQVLQTSGEYTTGGGGQYGTDDINDNDDS